MKIFLSYPSDERAVAERLEFALLALGHDVFFDRADLAPGLEYDQAIVRAVETSDLFVFLITPMSVSAGRYTLTELGLAERRWPHPSGRVLPVMLRATPIDAVPAYLRAVSIFTPSGEAVAETAQETQRLARALPFVTKASRRLRTRTGAIAALATIAVVGTALWLVSDRAVPPLSSDVRHRARAVAPTADSGFVLAVAAPNQVLRFSAAGAPIGQPIALMGEPVSATRMPRQMLIVTRAPDGVTVLDWKYLHIVDTIRLDASRLAPLPKEVRLPRLSTDIQSAAAWTRGMMWAVTGERDGDAAIVRFRPGERRWEVPTWVLRPEGVVGADARGLLLRLVKNDLWAVTAHASPSSLYHIVDPMRIDEFGGRDLKMVSCAHDVATSAAGNLLLLSCDNELQEVSVEGKALTLVSARRTLPSESAPGNWTDEILIPDGRAVVVALNTEVNQPSGRPRRARIAEIDSAGAVATLLDVRDAVVRSMAVTTTMVIAVLRRADGSTDAMRLTRRRP
ncbi:MAG: toll/interleukin-1 receptor domain-containing protein [bacterium]